MHRSLRLTAFLSFVFTSDASLRADVRLPAAISSHMVLQQQTKVAIWGQADAGEAVKVSASWGAGATATADAQGRWRVDLETPAAGGPFTLDVAGASGVPIRLEDVLVGEVWLCGGQSNMEWAFAYGGVRDAEAERAAANDPQVRIFDVPNVIAASPLGDCKAQWQAVTPESVHGFSCVGWFFARELRKVLGVPVGLIGVNWGGTVAQAWVHAQALQPFARFAPELEWVASEASDPGAAVKRLEQAWARWWAGLDGVDLGVVNGWAKSDFDDQGWETAVLPGVWSGALAGFDGVVWYRRAFELPAELAGRDLELVTGAIDDMDVVWLDGEKAGGTEVHGRWNQPRTYFIPAAKATAGRHVLALRVVDTGGAGGMTGAPEELALRVAGTPGAGVSLAGDWKQRVALAADRFPPWPQQAQLHANVASVLWNGMVAPIVPFGIRGALWYQGESNRGHAAEYAELMPALIADWRARFERPDFPFFFVQIAPFNYDGSRADTAEVREAQRRTLRVKNTGMVVTMDIGDPADIHPANKQEVGRRLALWALARSYGKDLECSGPLYESQAREGRAIRVRFTHATGGLVAKDNPLTDFELRAPDGIWHPATATIDGETVLVTSDAVPDPIEARFAFCDACSPNLFNSAGLPASPFCPLD